MKNKENNLLFELKEYKERVFGKILGHGSNFLKVSS